MPKKNETIIVRVVVKVSVLWSEHRDGTLRQWSNNKGGLSQIELNAKKRRRTRHGGWEGIKGGAG